MPGRPALRLRQVPCLRHPPAAQGGIGGPVPGGARPVGTRVRPSSGHTLLVDAAARDLSVRVAQWLSGLRAGPARRRSGAARVSSDEKQARDSREPSCGGQEWPAEPAKNGDTMIEHKYAEVNGVRLHYARAGEGKLILFLHGF